MQIFKIELKGFINYLDTLDLPGQASRMRTKFKNMLIDHYIEFEKDYTEIQQSFQKKEITEEQANQEINILLRETIGINEDEANMNILISVKYSILNDPNTHKGEEAQLYDRLCELFESVKEEN